MPESRRIASLRDSAAGGMPAVLLRPARRGYHPDGMLRRFAPILFAIAAALLAASCGRGRYVPESLSRDANFRKFLSITSDPETDPATRYAAMEPIISRARDAGEHEWLIAELGSVLESHPEDPYGAYYLMAMAESAREMGSEELAIDYFRRLLADYPDLIIRDRPLHLLALREVASGSGNPREAIAARLEMQRRFSDLIDPGRNLYALAGEYRKIGDWDGMYRCLSQFQQYPGTVVPGVPDALWRAQYAVQFHEGDKSWTMENLDDLVGTIQYAIRTNDRNLLKRYQSKNNFFIMNWSQDVSDRFSRMYDVDIGSFLKSSVRYRAELEPFSNENEAYLWTAGWSWKIRTWYLYFHRVDYPADPEINGRWEWAGIYLGERL